MEFIVRDRSVQPLAVERIITGNTTYRASFDLDEEWLGFVVSAVFKYVNNLGQATTIPVLLDANGECSIPMAEFPGQLYVGVRGINIKKDFKASELSKCIPVVAGARGQYLNEGAIASHDSIIEALIGKEDKPFISAVTGESCAIVGDARTIATLVNSRTYITNAVGKWVIQLPPAAEAGDMVSVRMTVGDEPVQVTFFNENVVPSTLRTAAAHAKIRITAEFDGTDWVVIFNTITAG